MALLKALPPESEIDGLMGRLSSNVADIIRLDLIQKVGCALRTARNTAIEKQELEDFAESQVHREETHWATW